MGVVVVEKQPYRRMVRTLREFEGWRCLWRVPVSALLFVAVPVLLVAVTFAGTAIAGSDFNATTALIAAAVTVGGSTYVLPRLTDRELHRKLIADRLWTWEEPNPSTTVSVLLREADVDEAKRALRNAGFNPGIYMTTLSMPPDDAPALNVRVNVEEPRAHPQSVSDDDRVTRIGNALRRAALTARVGGLEVRPD